ncbi:MAG: hypothetical protein Q9M40_02240 [Sulfurimonas sp.]|nr:hypothetical protein [Sulfurimonas sp.]
MMKKQVYSFEAQNFKSLARSIEKLINDKSLLAKIAKNGQIKSKEKFSSEKQTLKLVDIFPTLL